MYTFAPIPTEHIDHVGFFLVSIPAIAIWLVALYNAKEEGFSVWRITAILAVVLGFTYHVSYVWTHQEPKVYANVKVEGKLVGFVAEGWNQQSGKTRADHHVSYVVYAVPEGQVMLGAANGLIYPQRAILYKN